MGNQLCSSPSIGLHAQRALNHIGAAATGAPIDADLRVTLHFHPDRLHHGESILAAMTRDGRYKSQFETGTSNGGLTAYPGGDRSAWEDRIFGAAYADAPPADRPKYGALNFDRQERGASPRFGSSYFRMAAGTLVRTTFCFPDSVYSPRSFGLSSRMDLIRLARVASGDPLDGYIEAHVHGSILFSRDVEALVIDECYRGTDVERLSQRLPCAVEWHPGFRLHVDVLGSHAEYRGAEIAELGKRLARGGWLTAREIGDAARTGRYDAQALKRVWHCVAAFGVG